MRTRAPRAEHVFAIAEPIPAVAPVINMTLQVIVITLVFPGYHNSGQTLSETNTAFTLATKPWCN
jgi:hypothetical protein